MYAWNAETRLIEVKPQTPADGDKKVDFVYDYLGRRVKKAVYDYTAGAWTLAEERLFVYDGWNLVEEIRREGGNETSRYFVWGKDLSGSLQGAGGIGGLVATIDGSSGSSLTYYFCYDGNGNVGQVLNAADGSIAAAYEYDPYGKIVRADGDKAGDNPFRFSTKYADDETGLVYYGYRYYASELGRWISRDPIGELGGLNFYLFVKNNSILFNDYLGFIRLNPNIWSLVQDCTIAIVKNLIVTHFTKWFNNEVSCKDIRADIRYGLRTDCNKTYEIPKSSKPITMDNELWKDILNCVLGTAKSGAIDKYVDNETEKKLILKLLDEAQGTIENTLKDAKINTNFKIRYHCASRNSTKFNVISDTTIEVAGKTWTISIEDTEHAGKCTDILFPTSISHFCCKCNGTCK